MSDSIYTDGTMNAKDKLGMVNICLAAIGEIPLEQGTVLSELQSGTDGAIARDIVSKTMIEVQNEGYFFNTDYGFIFIPDEEGFIVCPPNLLRVDSGSYVRSNKIVKKNEKLYDLREQSFIFTSNLKADAVWLVNYDELPFNGWNYIAHKAATTFEKATIASPDLGSNTEREEAKAKHALDKEHIKYMDYNLLGRVSNINKNPKWFDK